MSDYEILSKHVVDLLIANGSMGERIKEQDIKIAKYENTFNQILLFLGCNKRVPNRVITEISDLINQAMR